MKLGELKRIIRLDDFAFDRAYPDWLTRLETYVPRTSLQIVECANIARAEIAELEWPSKALTLEKLANVIRACRRGEPVSHLLHDLPDGFSDRRYELLVSNALKALIRAAAQPAIIRQTVRPAS